MIEQLFRRAYSTNTGGKRIVSQMKRSTFPVRSPLTREKRQQKQESRQPNQRDSQQNQYNKQ